MPVKEYQQQLKELLNTHFEEQEICTEWYAKMNKGLYSPRVDVAVGPFAFEDGVRYMGEHIQLFEAHLELFKKLSEQHLINLGMITDEMDQEQKQQMIDEKLHELYCTNQNGRCFLAIEIENKSSRKHLMGGAVNAAVLGKIGIAVGYTDKMHRAFLNLYRYFRFLRNVDKPTFNTSNLLIISRDQLTDILTKQ